MGKTIISLTTIPPRMDAIGPTLQSLVDQTAQIDAIILWIPEKYRRTEFSNFSLPEVPEGVEIRRCELDYGPATKILPAVRAFRGQDARIIYCDDDRIFHAEWAANMLRESDRHPGQCMAEAGEVVELTIRKAFYASRTYQLLKFATLGVFGFLYRRKNRALDPGKGRVDICKGYGGVLVRPEFFKDAAFDIPDLLWTVDDFWLSGQLALNNVPIRKITSVENSDKTALADVSALEDLVYDEHDRHDANLACIRYFQDKYGIWKV